MNPLKIFSRVQADADARRREAVREAQLFAFQIVGEMSPIGMLAWMEDRIRSRPNLSAVAVREFSHRVARFADELERRHADRGPLPPDPLSASIRNGL